MSGSDVRPAAGALPPVTTDGRTARSGQGGCTVEVVNERELHLA